ncbi:hypothetical protein BS333_11885 [Vibrio azureus]|uniref:Uncharacterized protein n=1 Tax=Vibrio azureus NBRC 104587 TaxID=1219077 RepID=U3CA42_9VIBR|nr:hypothetical protein [Vibrio azureus]AUI87018.1 hypothetical protein BS333_11885 [Vibrio azureus]GAD78214.1 hypothetical protein VAZ01S_156_00010 [Vibrio azureus NBRC 104587]
MKFLLVSTILFTLCLQHVSANEIRSANSASCEQSDFQPWEISTGIGQGLYEGFQASDSIVNIDEGDQTQFGVRITYRFGGARPIDCSRFQNLVEREQAAYTKQLELKVAQLEAKLAKQHSVDTMRVKFK